MFHKLLNIRLTYIYPTLFVFFLVFLTFYHHQSLSAGQLALFSVNSFLFGYYFGPLLSAQKGRVDSLNKAVRQEAMVILDVLAQSHLLHSDDRHELKVRLKLYLDSIEENVRIKADNVYYDELLRYTKLPRFEKNSVMDTIYGRLSKTQENRDNMQNLFETKLFSHEWLVLAVLFMVTLYFVLQTDYGNALFFRILLSVLCTGLSLLVIILIKYATLTHKQAKKIWEPLKDLDKDHFEDITPDETRPVAHRIH